MMLCSEFIWKAEFKWRERWEGASAGRSRDENLDCTLLGSGSSGLGLGGGLDGGRLVALLLEQLLVVLLSLDESILEKVRVWNRTVSIYENLPQGFGTSSLSGLAKRMARVTASASPSLTSAAAFHTQLLSEPTLGDSFISGTM